MYIVVTRVFYVTYVLLDNVCMHIDLHMVGYCVNSAV